MHHVAIWNRGLTHEEIAETMTGGIHFAVEPGGKLTIAWAAMKY
jgi:hypothetical protein